MKRKSQFALKDVSHGCTKTSMRTIIVEDTPDVMEVIENILQGCSPACELIGKATRVDEAYQLIKSLKPDLLLLDIEIIGGTSFDILKRLRDEKEALDTKIIFITGYGNFENATKAIKCFAFDFITKPIDSVALQEAILKAVNQKNEEQQKQVAMLLEVVENEELHQMAIPMLKGQLTFVEINDLTYMESDETMAKVHTFEKRMIHAAKPLSYFSKLLINDYNFFYINGSQVINLSQLQTYEHSAREIVLKNGVVLKASKRGGQDLKYYWDGIKTQKRGESKMITMLKKLIK